MPIRAVNNFEPVWFTPASEADEETPTRFKICGLDGIAQSEVAPELGFDAAGEFSMTPKGQAACLRYGLLDWENLQDGPNPAPADPAARQACLPFPLQVELVTEIFALTNIGAEDKKK